MERKMAENTTHLDGLATVAYEERSSRGEHGRTQFKHFALPGSEESAEYAQVTKLAAKLHAYLNQPRVRVQLIEANQPGNSSAMVQNVFVEFAEELGFTSERAGLFHDAGLALRPDYFRRVGESGILIEVERGKTTINNMDLLDFWKCHLCGVANHLFLMVPSELRQNEAGGVRREFESVQRRLEHFFREGNETNVRSLSLFGY